MKNFNHRNDHVKVRTTAKRSCTSFVLAATILSTVGTSIVPMTTLAAANNQSAEAAAAANSAYEVKNSQALTGSVSNPQKLKNLFNPFFYALQYPDAMTEAGTDPEALYQHFLTKGLSRGYLCNSYFDIKRYRDDHPELETYLGDDWDMWVAYFFMGNEAPSGLKDIFDATFYAETYPDAVKLCGTDPDALYEHFVNSGILNGYQCNPYFNIYKYRAAHSNLTKIYGNDWNNWLRDFYVTGLAGGGKTDYLRNTQSDDFSEEDENSDSSVMDDSTDSSVGDDRSDVSVRSIPDSNSVTDGNGNILVPVSEIGEYLTLEELKEICGDNLVLVADSDGFVTFVGGHFTDITVANEDDSVKAIQCMLELIGLPDSKILKLNKTVGNSKGDTYYQFTGADINTGYNNPYSNINLGVDDKGKVISLSSNCGAKLDKNLDSIAKVNLDSILERTKMSGETLVSTEFETVFDSTANAYCKVFYGKDDTTGYISKYVIQPDNEIFYIGTYSDVPTKENNVYAFDFLFSDDIQTEEHTFTDYFGNNVKLTVASVDVDGVRYSYLVDKERKIAANLKPAISSVNLKKGFTSIDDQIKSHFVQSFVTVQKTYDEYKKLGFFDNLKNIPFIIGFDNNDQEDNASCGFRGAYFSITVNDNTGNASFDSLAHEVGHGVLDVLAPTSQYLSEKSLHEGFADINGNILEMILYLAGDKATGTGIDLEKWSIEESVGKNLRCMGDPESLGDVSKVGGQNYSATYTDHNDCHAKATIYGNICYRMNKELNIPLEDLLKIWYDAMPNITATTSYKDVKGYITYSTMLHGYNDLADKVSKIFDDANVDGFSDNWSDLKPAEGYITDVPVVVDNFEDIYDKYFKDTSNKITFTYSKNDKALASIDKYGNVGSVLKDGEELPDYDRIHIKYKNNDYSFYMYLPGPDTQGRMDADDILSALNSEYKVDNNLKGFYYLCYELEGNDDETLNDYYIRRVDNGTENYVPVYINLTKNLHYNIPLKENSKYEICKLNQDKKMQSFFVLDVNEIKERENEYPVLYLKSDTNSEFGVSVSYKYETDDNTQNQNQGQQTGNNNGNNGKNVSDEAAKVGSSDEEIDNLMDENAETADDNDPVDPTAAFESEDPMEASNQDDDISSVETSEEDPDADEHSGDSSSENLQGEVSEEDSEAAAGQNEETSSEDSREDGSDEVSDVDDEESEDTSSEDSHGEVSEEDSEADAGQSEETPSEEPKGDTSDEISDIVEQKD
ncbi:hypothetical protein [Oribacterium sp. KHPX15]|uniref:hypothetical protein n=1 Tax=Oribacterium sp. KHPX15 TaxID=1855342 RepID=UPI000AFE37C6|nr:hypothetical protein [Oribacterium sp. KHPX15]